jgi:malonyl-CoA decarboxylase
VSLGNFLIKRVAEELKRELPQLRVFCTLSPMPGFARWLRAGAPCEGLPKARHERLAQARAVVAGASGNDLDRWAGAAALRALPDTAGHALTQLAAFYLAFHSVTPGGDPVARFHLDTGARLERLNPLGDLSAKGVKQSFGLMVNYLYDLQKVEMHHEKFSRGETACSRAIASFL